MNQGSVYQSAMQAIDRFLESLHEVRSPFEFATSLVKVTARQYNADIATLFRVTPSKTELIAEAGYDQKGEELRASASYYLDWNARSESDMPRGGLTAWVAVSGKPLFVSSAEELLDTRLHPAHRGVWDAQLHPTGPGQSFGCLYAVPLKVAGKESTFPRDSVLGVYKIERRQDNPAGVFTREQIAEFDLAAKQISLVILLYERGMARVLSDARHAVEGRLADAIQQLDILHNYFDPSRLPYSLPWQEKERRVVDILGRVQADAGKVASWLRQSMQVYANPYEIDGRTLSEFVRDTIEARVDQQQIVLATIKEADDRATNLRMVVAQSWDLHTLLLSLLNNAIEHSGCPTDISFEAEVRPSPSSIPGDRHHVVFTVSDHGKGIREEVIRAAEAEEALSSAAARGTGLRRVYRVARFREWRVTCNHLSPGTQFEVEVTL